MQPAAAARIQLQEAAYTFLDYYGVIDATSPNDPN
jgi:hypothetical protein